MRIHQCLVLLAATANPTCVMAQTGQSAPSTGASFVDNFSSFDHRRWLVSNGWANGPHQDCTWTETSVKVDGNIELSLTDRPSGARKYSCGELQSREFYRYGTFEVRMRAAVAPGLVSAFFTYTGPPHGVGRPHDEIDIEILGKAPSEMFLNYFVAGRQDARTIGLNFNSSQGWHDYAFEWLPESIRWFVDGRLVREISKGRGDPIPSEAQKIYISIWNGAAPNQDAWLGRFVYPGRPLVASYEFIAFTQVGTPCQFPSSIVCRQSGAGPMPR